MRKIFLILFTLGWFYSYGQLQENFSDGDFTRNPVWVGDAGFFTVNAAEQLQTNGPAVTNTELQLATPCQAVTGTTWEFYARLNLATSSGNYADIYLISDSANFKGNNSGYFVRIGGTPDEVSLFRKDAGSAPIYVINGRDGTVGTNNNVVRVKVTREVESRWTLWLDKSGTGQEYQEEGSAVDARYQQSAYGGLLVKYSAANNQRFFFDDFTVTDRTAPLLQKAEVINNLALDVLFNEPIALTEAQVPGNYRLQNVGEPVVAVRDVANPALVHLTFPQVIPAGQQVLTVAGLEDLFRNRLSGPLTHSFSYHPPVVVNYRDVRINEVLADFSPTQGLPAAEFLELYNNSNQTLNLEGWQYADAGTARGTLPAYVFRPGSYVILCRAADTALFRPYGPVLGLAVFPTLNDDGDVVRLFDETGKLIDKISYTTSWYNDTRKAAGGWSLELINPLLTCAEATNWTASADPRGGTPGKQNANYNNNPDTQPPTLLQAHIVGPNQVKLTFSERLDSLTSLNPNYFTIGSDLTVTAAAFTGLAFTEVLLTVSGNWQPRRVYEIRVRQIRDCAGNVVSPDDKATAVLPEPAAAGNVVINEILFNPRSGGVDFVEIVNRSDKYLNLQGWRLGNMQPDSASDLITITDGPFLLAPQQYLVLTTRPDLVQSHYPAAPKIAFLKMTQLPSYPDDRGTVLLYDENQHLIDRFAYEATMHFKLLDDLNGVSLERIYLQGDSSAGNWHSAASTVGYATPGYKNSQYYERTPASQFFTIEPEIFTPDDDGDKDFTTINYRTEAVGYVANITIYNAGGHEIKRLVKNELLAQNGFFRWDGLDERGRKVPVGYYVLYIELFNLQGQVKAYKETVVVGARF